MTLPMLAGKRAVVVGLGASGVAACRLLKKHGAQVIATDSKTTIAEDVRASLLGIGVDELVLGGHRDARLSDADLIVISPGVPMFTELRDAEVKGVPIWGEVELAVRALKHPAPIVAIGGTNGKSTTTSLVAALLEAAGKKVFAGGNLGEPLALHTEETFDVIVLEVSSFQMERVEEFKPKVSVLLNITPDHLDRYESEAAYADAKGNAFVRQTEDDLAVIPFGDEVCAKQAARGRARVMTFGVHEGDAHMTKREILFQGHEYNRDRIVLQGGHNALNIEAALLAVSPWEIDPKTIMKVLESFEGLAHRMAFVRERGGVRFYDDSKGTNVGAAVTAIRGIREDKVVLIAGGKDKGGSYEPLSDALRERGRAAVVIGEAKELIVAAIGDAIPVKTADSMDEAVSLAAHLAKPGDAVLLSPACSSFDMFNDYKHRGDAFVRAVKALPEVHAS